MRIAFITSGAAGMFCGSCLRDNALVRALQQTSHDAILLPTYTPIRTDEPDVSDPHIFYGGINVYLQDKSSIFRHTPRLIDKLFDWPALLRYVSRNIGRTQYDKFGDLTISILQGRDGHQRKELNRLVEWLKDDFCPEIVLISNVLLSGLAPELKQKLNVPVLATLQGDDIFLDALLPEDRRRCIDLIRKNCESLDGLIATSRYYADHMSDYLGLDRSRIGVVWPGIHLDGHGGPKLPRGDGRPVIGYFARIAPEKGLHHLVDAFIELRKQTKEPVLKASGWLGERNVPYLNDQKQKLKRAGLLGDFEYVDSPDHESKVKFLRSLDVFSVPTEYREPKGLYLLEAWANGVPAVLPAHGSFPELMDASGGGRLVPPGDIKALAAELAALTQDRKLANQLGEAGRDAVREQFSAAAMAQNTVAHLEQFLQQPVAGASR